MGMEYRRLGSSGLKVSALSFGGWLTLGGSVAREASKDLIRLALDRGINFLDLADIYGAGEAERAVGEALQGRERHDIVISSKVCLPVGEGPNDRGLSRKHILRSVERSLQNLRTDHLDLYFCHREDPETPIEETARAMNDLIHQGKILYWGTSEFSAKTLLKTHALLQLKNLVPPTVEQPRYNLVHRGIERRVLPLARRLGMGMVAYSPLAGGLLTGKYNAAVPEGSRAATTRFLRRDLNDKNLSRVRQLSTLSQSLGCTSSQLAIAWLLSRPGISSVILGASSQEQLESNLQALELQVPADTWRRLEQIFPL